MILALTANGPGEFAGWMRPLLAALYTRDPQLEAHVFCVPDDYATGREGAFIRALFPSAHVHERGAYVRFALGQTVEGVPAHADRVQYLGGDLMHAARLHARLGGIATSYKFSRKRYAEQFARVFAVDDANRRQLIGWGVPAERITIVGNLAIDGALGEASGAFGDPRSDAAGDGVMILPGSRKLEIQNIFPMFVRVALQIRRRLPGVPIAFARSPFTSDEELAAALAAGGTRVAYGARATVETRNGEATLVADGERFPLVRASMRAAASARLAVSIPGTKLIELAALGVPAVTIVPMNAPELAVINGPLQYVGKLPLIGTPLKRAAVMAVASRFTYFAQPNIDAGRELHPEIRGTIFPSRVAAIVAERYADRAWRDETSAALRALYADQVGAAGRMAAALLEDPLSP